MVEDNSSLNTLCEKWRTKKVLAMDTEFIRVNTFYPKLGLLQVCDGEGSYLLDPLSISQWDGFKQILSDPEIVKVFHSCSEDLIVFNNFFSTLPTPLFDTQRAAAFLDYGYSISYQNLVEAELEISLSKGETRSDWLQRPLSAEQLAYAALDVAYLPQIYRFLFNALESKGRLAWVQSDCQEMLENASQDDESDWSESFKGVSGAWRLEQRSLEALKRLSQWREIEARRRDKPRNWIAKDADLIAICAEMPQTSEQLNAIPDLSRQLYRQDSEALLALIQQPHEGPAISPQDVEQPLSPAMRKALKRCQEIVKNKATQLEIAPELLARKRQLIPMVDQFARGMAIDWPESLGAWRRELLESDIRAALK